MFFHLLGPTIYFISENFEALFISHISYLEINFLTEAYVSPSETGPKCDAVRLNEDPLKVLLTIHQPGGETISSDSLVNVEKAKL